MAYYGPAGRGGGGWYHAGGGGDAGYMYGRGAVPGAAGLLGAGWAAQGLGAGEVAVPAQAATSMQQGYQGWNVGEQYLRELTPKPPTQPLSMIRRDTMRAAEAGAHEVLLWFHPTEEEEKRRHEIIDYAKQLIGTSLGCEVFIFGSVPLKTYLPDGDIDLTVITNTLADLNFIDDVYRILKINQQDTDSRISEKEIEFIDAEVKLIKCEIDNITMDISFNQIGGVSTLCFLELVDRQVGKNHLFKRSIVLIKAWCYNECHILGAHNWLLSTYALDILVLHIFNVFHKSLHGPLEVLYKFLEYYSKFDWDKYGLTLDGPISLSSLCNFVVQPTATNDDLLLGKESLNGSFDRLLLLPRDFDRCQANFRLKHLNIVDPLKLGNNLGRSVNKVNFYHIRGAFLIGAQKLRQILLLPSELVPDAIYGFFEKTLKKYGGEYKKYLVDNGVLQSPKTALKEDVSSLEISYISEDENRSTHNLFNLPDKGSNLLDLSGDLYLHLGCLRHVQYNLEAMFDEFHKTVQEASLAGLLNEDCFKVPVLKFLSNNNEAAAPPRLSLPLSTDTDRRNLSPLYCSHSIGDVPQHSNTKVHADSANQENVSLPSRTPSPPLVSDANFYHDSWIYATKDIAEMHNIVTYMPDTIVPLSSSVETIAADWLDLAMSPSSTSDLESSHDSRVYMTGDIPKSRGTGTYIPRMNCGYYRNHMLRKYRQRQPRRVHPSSQHIADERVRSQTPTRQDSSQEHVSKATHPAPFIAGAPTSSGTKQLPGGLSGKALDSQQQRAENGTPALLPLRLALSRHGENVAQGNYVTVPTTTGVQSSSPPRLALSRHGGNAAQGNHVTVPTTAGGQSSSSATGGKDFKPIQEETLVFGTLGPFSPTMLKPKFIEDFPPLNANNRPLASTMKSSWLIEAPASTVHSPKPSATAAQVRPGEVSAFTAQSPKTQTRPLEALTSNPRPGASGAQNRPEELYQLKDEADFPPLQARTR